jgi:peptidoglycan/xylan/chitin deacetylase (PgdA/CDA1 family)
MRPDERLGPKFLLYHDVAAAAGGDERRAREAFREHLGHVTSLGYRFVPMAEFVAGGRLGPRDAIITFDDAPRSFSTCVLPVLEDLGVSATVFLPTELVGSAEPDGSTLMWDEVAELAAEGVEFGCHGASHIPLDQVRSDRMRAEIGEATDAMLERGFDPVVFSYPFGRYDGAAKLTVRKAGYLAAFTQMKGGFDRYEIRRRVFTGVEGALRTAVVMNDRYFGIREAVRGPIPSRWLADEQPVPEELWGTPSAQGSESGHGTDDPRDGGDDGEGAETVEGPAPESEPDTDGGE